MNWFRSLGIATRLTIAILLAAVVAIVLIAGSLNRRNRQVVEALAVQNLVNSSAELGRNLDAFIQQEENRVANLATSRSVQQFMQFSVFPQPSLDLHAPTLADFTNVLRSDSQYRAVALLDELGNVLLSTEGNYVGSNYFQYTFAHHLEATLEEPTVYPFSDEPLMWLSAPIIQNDDLIGRVVIAVSAEKLWQRINDFQIGQHGYAILVNRQGRRLAHGREPNLIFHRLSETGRSDLYAWLRQNNNGLVVLPTIDDSGRVYHGVAQLDTHGWKAIVLLHENEVLAPARTLTNTSIMTTLGLVVMLALIVSFISRYLLRSIPALAEATQHIASTGDLSQPIDIDARGEIRKLAGQFETMRKRLFDSNQKLERSAEVLSASVVERSRELAALSNIVATASHTQSRNDMLSVILRQSLDVMDAQIGGIWLAAEDSSGIELVVAHGMTPEMQIELYHFKHGESLAGHAYATGEPLITENAMTHPRLARAIAREQKFRAFAAFPLTIRDRNFGILGVIRRRERPFSPQLLALAESIAQQIGLALDNLDLVEQARLQTLRLASMQERNRIASDIHDSMAQMASYLHLQLDVMSSNLPNLSLAEIEASTNQHIDVLTQLSAEIRQFITNLRQSNAPIHTLGQTVRDEVQSLNGELRPMAVNIQLNGGGELPLSAETSTQIARIVGEALRNAQQHGEATAAEIHCERNDPHVKLHIRDNGKGFVVGELPDDGREHFGLKIMHARAERLGGWLTIDSHQFEGTNVQLQWKVSNHAAA